MKSVRLFCLAACVAALFGCVELSRKRVALEPEVIGGNVGVKKPGVIIPAPRTDGLARVRYGDIEGFYRVAKTDTLVSIAEKFYGDRSFAREISERNKDAIRAAGGVKRGMVLVLPTIPQAGALPAETPPPASAVDAALSAVPAVPAAGAKAAPKR